MEIEGVTEDEYARWLLIYILNAGANAEKTTGH